MNTKIILGIKRLIVGALLFASTGGVITATESPRHDSMLYYKIGGGRHVSVPPSLKITTMDLSLYAGSLNGACSDFDPVVSIKSSLEQLKDGKDNAINAIESAAGAAIANLPGYLLQKANPGLYDLFQNALLRAQTSFSMATKSCERIQHEISQNINPFAEWITLSQGDAWQRTLGWGEKNIHRAQDEAKHANQSGIPWVGGEFRGGQGQEPIHVRGDTAVAGLNLLTGGSPEKTANLPSEVALTEHFPTSASLNNWVVEVLGEEHIAVCDGCERGRVPGRGLMPLITQTSSELEGILINFIEEKTKATQKNLAAISAPGLAITYQVIQSLQQQAPSERAIFIGKLAHEIAQARTIEQALLVRRLLLTGVKEGNIAAIAMATESIDKAVAELDQEIQHIVLEQQVREDLVSDTVMELLRFGKAQRETGRYLPESTPRDSRPLRDGGIRHEE